MDFEHEDIRPRYHLCRFGFSLIALSLALLCVANVAILAVLFGARREVALVLDHPAWFWMVSVPITWVALLGTYMLWGRWSEPNWQRKVGLLLVMNALDAGIWLVTHADRFGVDFGDLELGWSLFLLTSALSWFELMLAASLAGDLSAHLGRKDVAESAHAASALALIGIAIWTLLALSATQWGTWPLVQRPAAAGYLLMLLATVLNTILTFQVTVLSLTASRLCGAFLRALNRRERDEDLLISRSESENDDIIWK